MKRLEVLLSGLRTPRAHHHHPVVRIFDGAQLFD